VRAVQERNAAPASRDEQGQRSPTSAKGQDESASHEVLAESPRAGRPRGLLSEPGGVFVGRGALGELLIVGVQLERALEKDGFGLRMIRIG